MENIVLAIHLLLALSLVGIVLLQPSEGGGLGMGGGGGGGNTASRPALSGLGKLTWALAIMFITTSLILTIMAAQTATGTSVMDRMTGAPSEDAPAGAPATDDLMPPPAQDDDAPLVPPRAD